MKKLAMAAFVAGSMMAGSAQATTVFQSLPNLAVAPATNAWCSSCGGLYKVYDTFSLGSATTLNQLTFAVMSDYGFPGSVQVGFYTLSGSLPGTSLATYNFNVADFLSTVNTGFNTTLVTVALPNLALAAGSYDISFWNASALGIPGYAKTGGNLYQQGAGFYSGQVAAFSLSGNATASAVPEPATWAMMLAGFGAVGFALRRRAKVRTAVSFG